MAKRIASSLEHNPMLTNISCMDTLDRSGRFYLDLNRMGRRFIYQDGDILFKLWPFILERVAKDDSIHILSYFLRERIDLILVSTSDEPCLKKTRYV